MEETSISSWTTKNMAASRFSETSVHIYKFIKGKEFNLEQATKAHRGSRGIALLFL
jgi:hypothetical protein